MNEWMSPIKSKGSVIAGPITLGRCSLAWTWRWRRQRPRWSTSALLRTCLLRRSHHNNKHQLINESFSQRESPRLNEESIISIEYIKKKTKNKRIMRKLCKSVVDTQSALCFVSPTSPEAGATGGRKQPKAPPNKPTVTLVTTFIKCNFWNHRWTRICNRDNVVQIKKIFCPIEFEHLQ